MAPSLATLELLMRIAGTISSFSCCLTIMVYYSSVPLQKKSHNAIIKNIAISELFTAIGGILGISKSGSLQCGIQTFLTNYFPLTSIFWTTIIGYFLLSLLDVSNAYHRQKKILSQKWVHICCWGVPLLVTLLPLVTDHYGTFDGQDGWCFLRPGNKYPKWTFQFWIIVAFFGWVYVAIFIYFFLILYVFIKLSRADYPDPRLQSAAMKSLRRLISYPLIIFICWCSITIYSIWSSFHPSASSLQSPIFVYISFTIPLFSGTFTSLAFFFFSSEARYSLLKLLTCQTYDTEECSTNILKKNAVQILSIQNRNGDEEINSGSDTSTPTFHIWQTITKHFYSKIVPLPAPTSQGQVPASP